MPNGPLTNAAVRRCVRAWNNAYEQKLQNLAEDEDEQDAALVGREAYLCQLPPLSGYQNVRDYIACIMYAVAIQAIDSNELDNHLKGAKVALGALRHQPQRKRNQQVRAPKAGKNAKKISSSPGTSAN